MKVNIAERIRNFRQENNVKQKDFGELLGVTAQTISKWERGECYPDITLLPAIAEVLNCTVNDFFDK